MDFNSFFLNINIYIQFEDSLKNYDDFLYWISISTFLFDLHSYTIIFEDSTDLDVVLKGPLVVGFEFLSNKTCRNTKGRFTEKIMTIDL